MTQTMPRTLTAGTRVAHRTEDDLAQGEITTSDAWYDTLKLRGVAANQQVLVAWENGSDSGAPTMLWVRKADLVVI